ncbi:hypothetical protein N752_12775 [Desulforamulus aquiferis]|nr:EcsC family protein [Desulforamulus aquiferis]RYD04793.1 hypothetical protein N752_12775 [Desulforamulus aquiferis]
MRNYEDRVIAELTLWQRKMTRKPSLVGKYTKGIQIKVNNLIPDKIHTLLTNTIKNMVQATLVGSQYTTRVPRLEGVSWRGGRD